MSLYISSFCSINPRNCSLNGVEKYQNSPETPFSAFIKSIYKQENIAYPKFFKMDELSKLGFIASELLLKDTDIAQLSGNQTAIVLANKSSSFSSDLKHYTSIKDRTDYFPSPAVFVYTLPNIMMEEISIKKHRALFKISLMQTSYFNMLPIYSNMKGIQIV